MQVTSLNPFNGQLQSWNYPSTGSGSIARATAPTFPTSITVGAASGATGTIALKGTTSGTVTVSVADAAGTWTLKLPTTDGNSGEFLQTDGSGNTTWASAGGGITIGTTTITSGTTTRILYNNAGVVGEYTLTGTGTVVAMQTAPTLTGPVILNEAVGSSGLTITGATQTTSHPALNVAQTWNSSGVTFTGALVNVTNTASAAGSKLIDLQLGGTTVFAGRRTGIFEYRDTVGGNNMWWSGNRDSGVWSQPGFYVGTQGSGGFQFGMVSSIGIVNNNSTAFAWISGSALNSGSIDLSLRRAAAATLQLGDDVNGAAVNQTIQACNGITGTDKTGANLTMNTGKGTGAATESVFKVQTPTPVASGTTAQALTTRLTLSSAGAVFTTPLQIADTKIMKTSTSFSDGAAAATATLLNAPAAGNPTKWIPIDDNGTTRYIPAW